jgi:hypothetical protein
MWRDADTEARDLKSNALIARDVATNRWLLNGLKLCSESVGYSAPRLTDGGGVRDAPKRCSRYVCRRAGSTQN